MTVHAALPLPFSAKNTLVVMLGTVLASDAPSGALSTEALHDFSLSARKLQAYFVERYQLDEKYLLNLFDTDMHPLTVEQEIIHFLLVRSKSDTIQRIILYYAGYYREYGADLALQLQYVQDRDEPPQILRLATLTRILNTYIQTLVQRVIIFDGYLLNAHANMAHVAEEAIERNFALPPDDEQTAAHVATSVLYACQPASVFTSDPTQPSVFSEALLSVLEHGTVSREHEYLSLRTVQRFMNIFLAHHLPRPSVLPLLLVSAAQEDGQSNIDLPIFPDLGKSSGEATGLWQQATRQIRTISQRLRDNLSVQEAATLTLTVANVSNLKELDTIPVQSVEPPKALFVHRGKLYLSTPRFRSIDLVTGGSMNYADQPQLLDPLTTAHGDFLYLRTDERGLSCFATDTNQLRWSSRGPLATRLQDAPLIGSGMVYVLFMAVSEQQEHSVRAIDALTGRIVWEIVFQQGAPHSPMLSTTHLFVRTRDNRISAIDTAQLQNNWSFGSPAGSITFDPVVSQGLVYLVVDRYGQAGSILYALDLSTGRTRWSSEIDAHPLSIEYAPLVHNDIVYIVSRSKKSPLQQQEHYALHAFHAISGEKLWNYPASENGQEERILSRPLVIDDLLCLMCWDSVQRACVVHCLSGATAQIYLHIPLIIKRTFLARPQKGRLRFPPIVADRLLVIACTLSDEQGHDQQLSCVFILDLHTRSVRQEILLHGTLAVPPQTVHGLLYLLVQGDETRSSQRTRLLVIDTVTGQLCWEYAQADVLACSPVITRDTLCFATVASSAQNASRYVIRVFRPARG